MWLSTEEEQEEQDQEATPECVESVKSVRSVRTSVPVCMHACMYVLNVCILYAAATNHPMHVPLRNLLEHAIPIPQGIIQNLGQYSSICVTPAKNGNAHTRSVSPTRRCGLPTHRFVLPTHHFVLPTHHFALPTHHFANIWPIYGFDFIVKFGNRLCPADAVAINDNRFLSANNAWWTDINKQ